MFARLIIPCRLPFAWPVEAARPPSLLETCYTVKDQKTCFLVLNSNEKLEAQPEYLEDVASESDGDSGHEGKLARVEAPRAA